MGRDEKLKGYDLLHSAAHNKSTAFSSDERDRLGLRGLLPHTQCEIDRQMSRVLLNLERKENDLERYIFLSALLDRNERLFYHTVIENIEKIMPLIYTPTVGEACKEYAHIFRNPRGFYITPDDKGRVREMLNNWPEDDVRVVVITDGERILGLGDLGANGIGIPIGKLSLYVACAGIHPHQCLPVMFDVGTNNEEFQSDPLYLGYPGERVRGEVYDELMQELVDAIQDKFPRALIQFEDFATPNAIKLLENYRDRVLCFNDDIQGTAAVVLAGVHASTRISKTNFEDLRIMFLGAGSAATGIAELIAAALIKSGLSREEAYKRLWLIDSKGLIVNSREDLASHKKPFAHDHPEAQLLEAIDLIQPHVLIGATGMPGTFTQEVIEKMAALNERPAIFALSNPTSRAECTAEEAYAWSDGKAIFASGSPFDPVELEGNIFKPGQGNNAYVFPGIGLGAIACQARHISDEIFLAAAKALGDLIEESDLAQGSIYPKLSDIRKVSSHIAVTVARECYELGLAQAPKPDNLVEALKALIQSMVYEPRY